MIAESPIAFSWNICMSFVNVCLSCRYFFKKASDEFGSGVVMEEVMEDGDIVPLWEGKIIAKVDRRL